MSKEKRDLQQYLDATENAPYSPQVFEWIEDQRRRMRMVSLSEIAKMVDEPRYPTFEEVMANGKQENKEEV